MAVIITGTTSFIGIALVKRISYSGERVYAVIRPKSKRKIDVSCFKNVTVVESELQDLDKVKIDEKCDVLYHIGWSSDFENPRFNLSGQLKNVEYAEKAAILAHNTGCSAFVTVGSQAECGRISGCITSYTPAKPETAYAIAKVVLDEKVRTLCESFGIKFCAPRLLSGYGPFDRPGTMIMSCIAAGIQGLPFESTPAEQIWDYIYVDDIADALVKIASKGVHSKKYPIGSGVARSVKSYIKMIADITNNEELLAGVGKRPYADGQVMNLLADITELTADTGFVPQMSIRNGLINTIEWSRARIVV